MALGFTNSKVDSNLYFKVEGGILVMVLLYVDDLFLIRENKLIVDQKSNIATNFEKKDLGMIYYFLGMAVWQSIDGILLG